MHVPDRTDAVVTVGNGGRGFIIEAVTAAHCNPTAAHWSPPLPASFWRLAHSVENERSDGFSSH